MIEFKGVYKTYDNKVKALKDVNIRIDKGEFVFIVGASGAGKSTFLKLMMREEIPSAGEIIINDYQLTRMKRRQIPYLRRTMGIVFQDFRLINNMNVFDNVAFAMRVTGSSYRDVRKRVPYILGLVGLQNKVRSFPKELSGGEQQRVGLARALVNNPALIIADEPTGNIDPELSYEIMELLTEINRRGTTVVVVTHAHDLVHKFNRRVIEIQNGSIVSDTGTQASNDNAAGGNAADANTSDGVVADVITVRDKKVKESSFADDYDDEKEAVTLDADETDIMNVFSKRKGGRYEIQ